MDVKASTPPPPPESVGNNVRVSVVVGEGMRVTVCVGDKCVGLGGKEVALDRTEVAEGGSGLVTGGAFPHPVISKKIESPIANILFIFKSSLIFP